MFTTQTPTRLAAGVAGVETFELRAVKGLRVEGLE
jgi:hypothetical protein